MIKLIERMYVCEVRGSADMVTADKANADRYQGAMGGGIRVFTEEKPWISDRAPDSSREVQAVWASGWPTGPLPRIITAIFGSEGKWVAVDHNYRRTVLERGVVLAWRELPLVPEFPAGTAGTHWPTGWR